MPDIVLPATLWRRLAAFAYDGLLTIAATMAGLVFINFAVAASVARNASTPLHDLSLLPLYGYAIGVVIFAWSWARGGQTLGMRAWRLQVRRLDGGALRWPIALVRLTCAYALMAGALWLGHSLGAELPAGKARVINAVSLLPWAVAAHFLPCLISSRRRALSDWIAGTEIVQLPRPEKTSSRVES